MSPYQPQHWHLVPSEGRGQHPVVNVTGQRLEAGEEQLLRGREAGAVAHRLRAGQVGQAEWWRLLSSEEDLEREWEGAWCWAWHSMA